MTAACASLESPVYHPQAAEAVLVADGPATAPLGLIDFCVRTSACAGAAPSPQSGAAEIHAAPTQALDGAKRDRSSDRPNASTRFTTMLNAVATPVTVLQARIQESLTPERWRELVLINRAMNQAIIAVSDEAQYGIAERWAMPILEAGQSATAPRGDCEDYALEKRARLLAAGWPVQAIALAVARLPQGALHTVLIAQTDQGDFVLDNLHALPQPLAGLDYEWVSRQIGPEMDHWGHARVALFGDQGDQGDQVEGR